MNYPNNNPLTPKPESLNRNQYGEMSTNAQLLRAILNALLAGGGSGGGGIDYEVINAYLTSDGSPVTVRYDPVNGFTDIIDGTVYSTNDITFSSGRYISDDVITVTSTPVTLTVPSNANSAFIHVWDSACVWSCGILDVGLKRGVRAPNGGNIHLASRNELLTFNCVSLDGTSTIYVQFFIGV